MQNPFRVVTLVIAVLLCATIDFQAASAQQYPSRSVKLIVPYPPGGTADATARIVADGLSRKWAQPVVVENRAGAGGNVAAEFVGRSDPDCQRVQGSPHHREGG